MQISKKQKKKVTCYSTISQLIVGKLVVSLIN